MQDEWVQQEVFAKAKRCHVRVMWRSHRNYSPYTLVFQSLSWFNYAVGMASNVTEERWQVVGTMVGSADLTLDSTQVRLFPASLLTCFISVKLNRVKNERNKKINAENKMK